MRYSVYFDKWRVRSEKLHIVYKWCEYSLGNNILYLNLWVCWCNFHTDVIVYEYLSLTFLRIRSNLRCINSTLSLEIKLTVIYQTTSKPYLDCTTNQRCQIKFRVMIFRYATKYQLVKIFLYCFRRQNGLFCQ